MKRIVECVPNFSEGRRPEIVARIVSAMRAVGGASVLDVASNAHHNRTVVTMVGSPEAMEEAAYAGIAAAIRLIDMTAHQGEHPRIGAADVVPFVPVRGVSMDECVAMARRLGERVGRELAIPVYLYEAAATRPERRNLPDIRRGEYEGLARDIGVDPARAPDYGPAQMGKAGATVIGARPPLIAFNVNLETTDLTVAKAVARSVREATGGLPAVKALGIIAGERVQVTMNLTDYRRTPVYRAFQVVETEAHRRGVAVYNSEIVGLLPGEALLDVAVDALRLSGFSSDQVLENRLSEEGTSLEEFAAQVSASTATPGGGGVSALAAALGAALDGMVAGLTAEKLGFAAARDEMQRIVQQASMLRTRLIPLIDEDSAAFDEVMAAYALPKASEDEKERRSEALRRGYEHATEVPLQVARHAREALLLARRLAEAGSPAYICDAGVAGLMSSAALRGAALNVRVNLRSLKDPARASALKEAIAALEREAAATMADLERILAQKIP